MLRQDLLIPLKDGDIDAANAASLTGKLLQMSNGAVYDENGKARVIHDHKLEALEDLIEAANGQPVLVAYWFKHDRERIINHLSKLKIKVRDIKSSTDTYAMGGYSAYGKFDTYLNGRLERSWIEYLLLTQKLEISRIFEKDK